MWVPVQNGREHLGHLVRTGNQACAHGGVLYS